MNGNWALLKKLRLVAALPLAATAIPVASGLLLTLGLAFGLNAADAQLSLQAWHKLFSQPSLWSSACLSLFTAWGSTAIALCLAICLGFCIQHSKLGQKLRSLLPTVLAVPHAAFAIGFYFLLSPSGWVSRLVSPWLTGWNRPPDLATVQDPWGMSLMFGLAIKETPFLLLTLLAAMGQSKHSQNLWLGRSLGYGNWRCWITLTVPQLYRQMRFPLVVVLGYGLSVVDMAVVLGPAIPSTLAVQSTSWLYDPDPSKWPLGAAGALLLVLLSIFSVVFWLILERLSKPFMKGFWLSGIRNAPYITLFARTILPLLWTTIIASCLFVIVVWSFTWRWRFPDALPTSFSLKFWLRNGDQILQPALNTLSLGIASTVIGLIAAILLLETTKRLRAPHLTLLYAPLLLPQLAFLFGVQILLLKIGADGEWWAVVWVHSLFVFPYVVLTLHGPWQAYDRRYSQIAASLGKSPWHQWWQIKRPILFKPLCYAAALAFSVSVAQYLSTLFVGAGRFPTLTTEAIALASGGDRRSLAAVAFVQMALPMLAFAVAFALPKYYFKNRIALRDAT